MKDLLLAGLLALGPLSATIGSAGAYDRADYRKDELIKIWPQHEAWRLSLVAGGRGGTDRCAIQATAGSRTVTFFLTFLLDGGGLSHDKVLNFFDGGWMQMMLGIDDPGANDILPRPYGWFDAQEVKISADEWRFFDGILLLKPTVVNGLSFLATDVEYGVTWDTPNPQDSVKILLSM
jgi:hypothetical protein